MGWFDIFKQNACKTERNKINELNYQVETSLNINRTLNSQVGEMKKQLNDANVNNVILQNKINGYEKQIDYSFIPSNWIEIQGDVTTTKYQEANITIPIDIRDLLNSTCISKNVAQQILKQIDLTKTPDEQFVDICLKVNNYLAPLIKYKTNQAQFSMADVWFDGDSTYITKTGDCDLTARFYIRVINDILRQLKLYEYQKYIFLNVGFIPQGGHAWVTYYNPIKKRWDLIEATEEFIRTELQELPKYYDIYFVHNQNKIYKINENWRVFL